MFLTDRQKDKQTYTIKRITSFAKGVINVSLKMPISISGILCHMPNELKIKGETSHWFTICMFALQKTNSIMPFVFMFVCSIIQMHSHSLCVR